MNFILLFTNWKIVIYTNYQQFQENLLSTGKCKISDLFEENLKWRLEIEFLRGVLFI